jgi:phage tail sheath protein FI
MAAATFISAETRYELAGGNDGVRPTAEEYRGRGGDPNVAAATKSGLVSFEDIDEISIVAAPGLTFGANNGYAATAQAATANILSHVQRMRYRVAVLDSPDDQAVSQVRESRAVLDERRAALYYPWVSILDPVTRERLNVPPSGFVTGIYARNDIERGVSKAPANEVVTGAIGLETLVNKAQQEVLNPEGVNCIRLFENRGFRVWGARTLSSDPEWKYVNVIRYFVYLEHSIDRGTQWAVFESNGEALWANVRRTIEDFLFSEWRTGALLGSKPEEAFFVRVDRSTMSQNDIDNGRLVCIIGVAVVKPAEFVIFRIGQMTADSRP